MDKQKQSKNDGEKTQATPTSTDDESMTTSTASDTFESWTLVMDKQKQTKNTEDKENHIEELKDDNDTKKETSKETEPEDDDEEEQDNEPPPDYNAATGTTSATDEFSDEVSIISESDSCELLSTQNLPSKDKDFLHKLNLKFTTGVGLDLPTLLQEQHLVEQRFQRQQKRESPPTFKIALAEQNFRQRKRRSPSIEQNQKTQPQQQKSLRTTTTATTTTATIPYEGDKRKNLPFCCLAANFIKRGIFILLGLMAIIAFTKMFVSFDNPLQQKIVGLEEKNLALQYQIEGFEREVKKLNEGVTALKDRLQKELNAKAQKFQPEQGYKEWVPPTYKEGEAEKIANNLLEKIRKKNRESEELKIKTKEAEFTTDNNNSNNNSNINNNKHQDGKYKEENDFIYKNNKRNENLNNRYSSQEKRNSKEFKAESGERYFKQKRKGKSNGNNSKEHFNKADDNSEEKFYKHKQNKKRDSNEKFNKRDASNEKFNKRDNSNERTNKKRNNSKERQFNTNFNDNQNNNFKEHDFKNDYNNENFKTRQQPKRRDNSKEQFNNSKERSKGRKSRKSFDSDENQSGEWMEKLMLHREEARRTQEQILEAEKNWFLNRNDGREQWRVNDENLS